MRPFLLFISVLCALLLISACSVQPGDPDNGNDNAPAGGDESPAPLDDGPIAPGVTGRLGDIMPSATPQQRETFARGRYVLQTKFDLRDGMGPSFNLVSCGGCHERPTSGGGAGLYRNFFLGGRLTSEGAFDFTESAGDAGGVIRMFRYQQGQSARPEIPETTTIFAQRNPIPMFGAGLIAELSDEEILSRQDVGDADGDGISGKANFDRGFVGRFGRKSQTASLEAFIRGPLFNQLGITTNPLTDELRSRLPIDPSARARIRLAARSAPRDSEHTRDPHQVAAPDAPNFDEDSAPDPEMSEQQLFDLVSFCVMLAAPQFDEPTEQSNNGRLLFHQANCSGCHVPRINGPRGPVPAYSDFLLHDMGEELADGIVMKDAEASEFRSQPLWGLAATGPYLHDGRAATIEEAILAHGGEAQRARDTFAAFSEQQQDDVVEFLLSLGGRAQFSAGLLPPGEPIPAVGEYGGPFRELSAIEARRFERGRALYDKDFGFADGAGAMAGADGVARFNGDSCRACHFMPVIGGAGPRDVNVMRHGIVDGEGRFSAPLTTPNTILHKGIRLGPHAVQAEQGTNVFEHRQTPHNFGLGLIDAIAEETILSNADPADENGDGISGRARVLVDGRIGRFGWKAQVPSVVEFVRDAMGAEIGLSVAAQEGLSFGITTDQDGVDDPELSVDEAEDLGFFLSMMAGPPRQISDDAAQVEEGEILFTQVGCARCHIPSLPGLLGDVPLYSDLLLHEIMPSAMTGIEDGDAGQREFRTAPLWGLSQTAPYLHSGEADTIEQALLMHDGEAAGIRAAYEALNTGDREALLAFLGTL